VTYAVGTQFPPNSDVALMWDAAPGTVGAHSDPAGGFRVAVLILHHEALGPRQIVARPANPSAVFPEVRAPFLVVPGGFDPPRFATRR
jgi:hypothetical protein